MADQIEPHVTIVYPEEAPNVAVLRARLEAAALRIPPFPLRLGEVVAHEKKPARGVYHLIEDPVGLWSWLRDFLLAPPFVPLDVVAHASITHPQTSSKARKAWKQLQGENPGLEFRVGEVHLVAHDSTRWVTVETYPLAGSLLPGP